MNRKKARLIINPISGTHSKEGLDEAVCQVLEPLVTPFNTKGEPREAIVAMSMLQSGNWILPVSFGADIPYKPPFLAWCIAVFSPKELTGNRSLCSDRATAAHQI